MREFMPMGRRAILAAGLCLALVSGCDVVQYTQTQKAADVVVSVTVNPHPFHSGQSAQIYVTLRRERSGASGCRVRYIQYPKGSPPAADGAWQDIPEQGASGVYRTETAPFGSAGPWELKFGVKCLGQEQMLVFDYRVE